jgi:hypothetical protein
MMISFSSKMFSTASMIIFEESGWNVEAIPMIISMHIGETPSLIDT